MIVKQSIFNRLFLFLSNLKPSLNQRPEPIRVVSKNSEVSILIQNLKKACVQLGINNAFILIKEKHNDFDFIEELVNAFLIEIDDEGNSFKLPNIIQENVFGGFDKGEQHIVLNSKGEKIITYSWGDKAFPSITIIMPLGMPIGIMRNWVEKLLDRYHIITWETRGVFLPSSEIKNLDLSIESHLVDLKNILNFFKIEKTHLFAICQGVNLALYGLKKISKIVHSATLWHGDYNWNDDKKCTFTQSNFKIMVNMLKSGMDIEGLRLIMCNPKVIESLKKEYKLEVLPLIMYPYVTKKIFQNYISISESVIFSDLENLSQNIEQNVLIVTSKEDSTAHPLGSEELHKRIPNSSFYCREKGSHISFFDAPEELSQLFLNFY